MNDGNEVSGERLRLSQQDCPWKPAVFSPAPWRPERLSG